MQVCCTVLNDSMHSNRTFRMHNACIINILIEHSCRQQINNIVHNEAKYKHNRKHEEQ